MYQKMKAYVAKYHMLKETDKVIAGVSGGADSVCLLFALIELKKEMGFDLFAVHVHHGLRGDEADQDAEYVTELCRKQGIPLRVYHENVREYAAFHKIGEEEAGREIRKKCFAQTMKELDANIIALAHHQNDNVETFIWNLCRGTGLQGLAGIAPVSGNIIRPLLCVKRDEIEEYLKERKISYCTDETNYSNQYTRNRIRNHMIPYMEEQINEQSVSHMAETMEQMRMINEFVQNESAKYQKNCIVFEDGEWKLLEEPFSNVPAALKANIIRQLLFDITGKRKDIEAVHLKMVEELLEKQVGRKYEFPYEVKAIRSYEGITFQQGEIQVEEVKPEMKMRIFEKSEDVATFPQNPYTKWFDYDIIKNTVAIRHREPGDRIVIDKEGRSQKLKQYFINEKIPQSERERIWLVADGEQIMWIVGHRQSQAYQITEKTKTILEIKILERKE